MKRFLFILCVLVGVLVVSYYWFFVESASPKSGSYSIDMAEVRRLAAAMPGEKASEVRVEKVANYSARRAFSVAGDGWTKLDGVVNSYQIVFPASTVILDTALNTARDNFHVDQASYARMSTAMENASFIMLTHEHPDHVGGLVGHPQLAGLMTKVKLSKEQMQNPALGIPDDMLKGSTPLVYDKYAAVAPGVVVIKAPGHTPGSHMIFLQLAEGTEYLFLGDVAWLMRNVELVRGRPRAVSQFWIKEDRSAVMLQLSELNRIHSEEPNLHMVPGHDGLVTSTYLTEGLFVEKFK